MNTESPSTATSTERLKSSTSEAAQSIKDESVKLADASKDVSESVMRSKAEEARGEIASRADDVESAVNDIASTLGEHSDTLGHYANEFAESLSTFNDRLKNRSLDELASDARTLARENPAMFMLGAVTIGAVAARFFQASSPESNSPASSRVHTGSHTPVSPYTNGQPTTVSRQSGGTYS